MKQKQKEQIIKIFNNCDLNELNQYNYESKIILNLKKQNIQIDWYTSGAQKAVIKFKSIPNYVFKIPFSPSVMQREQAVYYLANQLFGDNFYLQSFKISQNLSIYYQEEVNILFGISKLNNYTDILKNLREDVNLKNIEIKTIQKILSEVKYLTYENSPIYSHVPTELILWFHLSIKYYGKEKFIKLLNYYYLPFFFQDFGLKNLGITKLGKPVIIDYY